MKTRSVADQGCLFRIPNPDFIHSGSGIPDPTIASKEEEGKIYSFPIRADASQANSQSEKDTVYYLLAAIQNPSLLPRHDY